MADEISFGRRLTMLAETSDVDETAVVFAATDRRETTVTWRALESRANQFARELIARGIEVGDLVAVSLPNSIDHLIASCGAWKAGASVLPLRHDLPLWERDRLLNLAQPTAIVANWPDGSAATISTDDVAATAGFDASPVPDRTPQWSRVIASSGSTGQPKLIVTPRPGLVDMAETVDSPLADHSRPVQLGASPLYHANGWVSGGPASVLGGNRTVLMERFDAEYAVDLIERHRVTRAILVPTMLMRIARLPNVNERDFSSLEQVIYGGASIPEWVVLAWFDLIPPGRFTFSYGSSEGLGSVRTTGDEWLRHRGTTGRPLNCDLRIVDSEGAVVANGTIGEIYVRPHTTDPKFEYLGVDTPEATADGYRTLGDLGSVDDDGYLYIADRRQDMIVSGGANVFPAEVEAALSEHEAVTDLVVIGLEDPEWGHRVHAIVELEPDAGATTAEELRSFCRSRLAAYKVPKSVEFVQKLPRNDAGKLNRTALAETRAGRATKA